MLQAGKGREKRRGKNGHKLCMGKNGNASSNDWEEKFPDERTITGGNFMRKSWVFEKEVSRMRTVDKEGGKREAERNVGPLELIRYWGKGTPDNVNPEICLKRGVSGQIWQH